MTEFEVVCVKETIREQIWNYIDELRNELNDPYGIDPDIQPYNAGYLEALDRIDQWLDANLLNDN